MNAEIIAVGSELLLGQIANTNAKFLSKELATIGVNVYFHTVVGDNRNRLKNAVEIAKKRSQFILFTGGLGPTKDDLTKETLAEIVQRDLVMDEESFQSIKAFFKKMNRTMTENNKKQAYVLAGSEVLPNDTGMAPGMVFTQDDITYMLLPGPPSELEPMFKKYGKRSLLKRLGKCETIESKVLRFFGIGESTLEKEIEDLIDRQSNPTIAPLASDGEVTLRLTVKHSDKRKRKELIDQLEGEILSRVGPYFYGYDETTIIDEMAKLLQVKSKRIAAAESLTGGLFQEELTSIPGASHWFQGGIVSYTNEVKIGFLGVQKETIDTFGAVSKQCAMEMAENVRKKMKAHIGISFTGVAGPSPLEGKNPGTVYIGISIDGKTPEAFEYHLFGNRQTIRRRAVKVGAWEVLKQLKAE
ncbi:competence/damage-inducible protein A [Fervidibacillus halotolerans]|uniref:Putative competence-damage inducible protein n=1 Tax=Fervidibacillus halotolerans TaxID=2980027 RepID=A0A9E8M278_9BACI|nr:competence/damage-inducible protein A [Fervidibacillus halotolerans]WAA13896.1 competence/damage-inducible protein A [Fervidibacillus halotolerans]